MFGQGFFSLSCREQFLGSCFFSRPTAWTSILCLKLKGGKQRLFNIGNLHAILKHKKCLKPLTPRKFSPPPLSSAFYLYNDTRTTWSNFDVKEVVRKRWLKVTAPHALKHYRVKKADLDKLGRTRSTSPVASQCMCH